jgi:hypothetical protein
MSDRVRTGELLAAIGAVGLAVLLAFGAWFSYGVVMPGGTESLSGSVGARHLGWFALAITAAAAIAGLILLTRVITSESPDRVMLQGPVAFVLALFALLVDFVRMLLFSPQLTIRPFVAPPNTLPLGSNVEVRVPSEIALGGWLGLLALVLLVVGTWISLSDERKDTAAARARTEALLAQVPVRPAPPATGAPESDADVVAENELPDASEPATPPTGDSA